MASRNEYSKKRLGEISTAAYNTSLENTNYRNRYCIVNESRFFNWLVMIGEDKLTSLKCLLKCVQNQLLWNKLKFFYRFCCGGLKLFWNKNNKLRICQLSRTGSLQDTALICRSPVRVTISPVCNKRLLQTCRPQTSRPLHWPIFRYRWSGWSVSRWAFETLILFKDKRHSKKHTLLRTTPLILIRCLGRRTKCPPWER